MKYLFILTFILSAAVLMNAQELKGIVKTSDGKPVEKAKIFPGGWETGEDGTFVFSENKSKFLIITKEKFRPLIQRLNGESVIEIVLETESRADQLFFPECTKKNTGKHVGANMKLFIPKGFKAQKGKDVDYTNFFIFSEQNPKIYMWGWAGPNSSIGYPNTDWINSSDKINFRSIYNEKRFLGWDFQGHTTDGKYWRYFRIFDESVYYMVDSSEQKDGFDKIFTKSCSIFESYFED